MDQPRASLLGLHENLAGVPASGAGTPVINARRTRLV